MERIFDLLGDLEDALQVQQIEFAELEKENAELRAGAGKDVPEKDVPLKVYDSAEDIVWERGGETGAGFAAKQFLGSKVDFRPFLPVIIKGTGKVRRASSSGNDWYDIAHFRILDVTAKPLVALVQEGDNGFEEDWEDMAELVRNYKGGLRQSLSTWKHRELGAKLLKVYQESHPGVTGPTEADRRAPVAWRRSRGRG